MINVEDEANSRTSQHRPYFQRRRIVLGQKELKALSDDPDELSQQLQAMAGPGAGPEGGQIYIDGFTGGNLPPKSSIREIRINSNPFSPNTTGMASAASRSSQNPARMTSTARHSSSTTISTSTRAAHSIRSLLRCRLTRTCSSAPT